MKNAFRWLTVLPVTILALILVSCDPDKKSISSDTTAPSTDTQASAEEKPSDASQQFQLGMHYLNGDGGFEKNESEGIKWIEQAAIQGFDEAEFELGQRYWEGHGVVRDFGKGVKWLEKASQKQNPMAQMILAEAYGRGTEIPKNDKEAIRLCKLLVEAFPIIWDHLGKLLRRRRGCAIRSENCC